MPLPPLRQAKPSVHVTRTRSEADSDGNEQESDTHDSEDELDEEEEGDDADDDTQDEEDAEVSRHWPSFFVILRTLFAIDVH